MSEAAEIEKVIARAKKMLNLANSSNYEAEAESAMKMVRTILAKYNLSMAEIEANNEGQPSNPEEFEFNKYKIRWQRSIVAGVCKLYGCYNFWRDTGDSRGNHHVIIGKIHNIQVVQSMSQYLVQTCRRLEREAFELAQSEDRNTYKFKTSFLNGASDGIRSNVEKIIREQEKSKAEPGTALVLIKEYDRNKEFTNSKYKLRSSRRRSTFQSGSAYNKGYESGSSISLNSQVSGSSQGRLT